MGVVYFGLGGVSRSRIDHKLLMAIPLVNTKKTVFKITPIVVEDERLMKRGMKIVLPSNSRIKSANFV